MQSLLLLLAVAWRTATLGPPQTRRWATATRGAQPPSHASLDTTIGWSPPWFATNVVSHAFGLLQASFERVPIRADCVTQLLQCGTPSPGAASYAYRILVCS